MKIIKHISIWVLISIVAQISILFYLDKYYLKPEKTFETKKVAQQTTVKKKVDISIPTDAVQISASFDGKYVSFVQDGNINVVSIENGQVKVVKADSGYKISMYKWLCDRDRMFISEKPETNDGYLILNYYDSPKDTKGKIENITYTDSKSEVQDIEVAPKTNVVYMKVYRYGTKSDIYSSNAMNDLKKVDTLTSNVGTVKTLTLKDDMIYEDKIKNKIYSLNDNKSIVINNVTKPVLLGVDCKDNIYIGSMVNDKINKVYYGSLDKTTDQWQSLSILNPCDVNDIFVSKSGNTYVNYNLKGQVLELKSNNITAYKGILASMSDTTVISVDNGKLEKTNYK